MSQENTTNLLNRSSQAFRPSFQAPVYRTSVQLYLPAYKVEDLFTYQGSWPRFPLLSAAYFPTGPRIREAPRPTNGPEFASKQPNLQLKLIGLRPFSEG